MSGWGGLIGSTMTGMGSGCCGEGVGAAEWDEGEDESGDRDRVLVLKAVLGSDRDSSTNSSKQQERIQRILLSLALEVDA